MSWRMRTKLAQSVLADPALAGVDPHVRAAMATWLQVLRHRWRTDKQLVDFGEARRLHPMSIGERMQIDEQVMAQHVDLLVDAGYIGRDDRGCWLPVQITVQRSGDTQAGARA